MKHVTSMLVACLVTFSAAAQAADDPPFLDQKSAATADGHAFFTHICQACHMADGKGAAGAGAYPALAANPRLASALYPAAMVLNGRAGMPAFGNVLSNQQIADVVNYVRTHFGNDYHDPLTAAQVQALRPQEKP
ncbi:mono/diheme cytochrome c family protein [Luteibacter sp. Sphag1AF]|uniref:c-type cytochrome n=1 Tax=Luteibacter sp. Sphag1AF TaxID=2587031 RepID=UPI001608B99D|nr:cytochrome c [Luteibacter sp. Sphag1AF]MBB3225704.1 mono/diheme cytochrome c family protein [Luteibacter sp. Sphag1AF]